ncbi:MULTISPECIES: glutamate-5-semialdehyde dehydrogenase [unclassified Helicobacter]|uniref:glutamate-5-semialdehyde dehydrogenase n=1 Tax=unclassified Helicobacter TaxID=2593540 RepID=UPI000CF012FC|nr:MULTISPECIES: glutamate-5-semialdehyde dehydrogenase [unclassified Helicobacter]
MLEQLKKTKEASKELKKLTSEDRNSILYKIANNFEKSLPDILNANQEDLKNAKNLSPALMDRLRLDEKRVSSFIAGIRELIALHDPIRVIKKDVRPNGLEIVKQSVPFGVVGMIYEARPNVTSDAIGMCLKTGNAVVLKGGSEALNTNKILVNLAKEALRDFGVSLECVSLVESREDIQEMLKLRDLIDVIIPRGGEGLIKFVVENSKIPVLETGSGNCHIFVDKSADFKMALEIIINAKISRVSVCNAVEKVLVHQDVAKDFVPLLLAKLRENQVEIIGCNKVRQIDFDVIEASEEDFFEEYLDYKICIKIVKDLTEAINHINTYSSHHSESIITNNLQDKEEFFKEIDSAVVYHNASTRFSDGVEFGFGAEIGISTQKFHARGPMGLEALCSYKYLVSGNGQIRE